MKSKLVALLMLSTLSCCETTKFTVPPPRAERINPPAEWRELWKDVEECSGLRGKFDNVNWFKALDTMYNAKGEVLAEAWYYPHDLYLAPENVDSSSNWSEEYKQFNIEHEILHDLSQTYKHPKQFDMCNLRYNP